MAEVLSASTANIDRREKLNTYRSIPGLRYILLIESRHPEVEYYCRNAAGEWETARLEEDQLITIDCGTCRTSLSLIDIYEDVVFPD